MRSRSSRRCFLFWRSPGCFLPETVKQKHQPFLDERILSWICSRSRRRRSARRHRSVSAGPGALFQLENVLKLLFHQVRGSVLSSSVLLLLSSPSVGVFRQAGEPECITARAYFREKRGFGCQRFSGSEPRVRTLHLKEGRGGGGVGGCQGQVAWTKPGGDPAELCFQPRLPPPVLLSQRLKRFWNRR